jgi:hypothetical protein
MDAVTMRHLAAFPGSSKGELARWWGVAVSVLNRAFKRLGDDLVLVDVEGTKAYARAEDLHELVRTEPEPPSTIRLLGGFDPYTLSLQKEAEPLLPLARRPLVSRTAGWISAVLLSGGAVAGTWTHEVKPKGIEIELSPWRRLTKAERASVEGEAAAIGAFLVPDREVRLTIRAPR